jgi:hypothetical protein
MTTDNTETTLAQFRANQEERVRYAARQVADRLRRTADDIEQHASNEDVTGIPEYVVHTATWGFANAQIDAPARWLRELALFDAAILRENKKKIREAVDAWEADGDDEKLVNNVIDPFLNGELS